MATLLDAVTTDTVGAGVEMDAACTVYAKGIVGNAAVQIELSPDGELDTYSPVATTPVFGSSGNAQSSDGVINVDPSGKPYFIRASALRVTSGEITVTAVEAS